MIVTNTYAYAVVLRLTHKQSGKTEEHSVKVIAYAVQEATLQAIYQIVGGLNINTEDYKVDIIFVGPDIEAVTKAIVESMKKGSK